MKIQRHLNLKKSHLVFIHPHFTIPGGAGHVVLEVARRLPSTHYRVTVLCINVSREYRRQYPGIAFVETGGYLSSERFFWLSWQSQQRRVNRILDGLEPDILLPSVLPANWWAFLYKKHRKKGFCLWYCHEPSAFIHSSEWRNAISDPLMRSGSRILAPLLKCIDRSLVRRFTDYVLCNSHFTEEQFRKTYRMEPQGYIHPGVDLNHFSPKGAKSNYLFVVSRLTRFKNIDVAIEAFSRLKNGDHKLFIGGEGEEKANLQRLIDRLHLQDRVVILGGIPYEKLPLMYAGAKILIFTTKNEPFGMVPVEAMACGTPVIAANSGGVRETVQSGFNGILLDRMNPQSLSETIDCLLSDPEQYGYLQHHTRKSVERFSWDLHVGRFQENLEKVTGKSLSKPI